MAQLAAKLGLPWAAIKSVTDDADGESAGDFRENLLNASARAAQAMERLAVSIGLA
jgi:adenosylhomocysteine nucleosidase